MNSVPNVVATVLGNLFTNIVLYLPQLVSGLLLLIIGVIIGELIKQAVLGFTALIKMESWAKLGPKYDIRVWPRLLAEVLRWMVLIFFLTASVEVWGIQKVSEVLNQLLVYLPNVFVAVFMGFVGLVVGNLVFDVVRHSAKGLGSESSVSLATLARYAVLVFSALLVLHQLGVAADLIRILFTGVIAMMALAGGLAFGLGGQELANRILTELSEKLKK